MMKRQLDNEPPTDPVLAQLDFLINGPPLKVSCTREYESVAPLPLPLPLPLPPPPPLAASHLLSFVAPDPRLVNLDALINGNCVEEVQARGPPGIFREIGGIVGWRKLNRPDSDNAITYCGA